MTVSIDKTDTPTESADEESVEFKQPVIAPIGAKQSLADLAYEHIKAAIVAGEVQPDHLYSVNQFALLLGVSRTPVREALLTLARQGLLQMDRNRGFRVMTVTQRDLDEVIDLRLMVEIPAVERIARMRKDSQETIDAAYAIYPRLQEAADSSDLLEFLSLDRLFHLTLVGGLKNNRLVSLVGELRDLMHLPGLRTMAANGQLYEAHRDHLDLLKAIDAGDDVLAGQIMVAHLERTRKEWH